MRYDPSWRLYSEGFKYIVTLEPFWGHSPRRQDTRKQGASRLASAAAPLPDDGRLEMRFWACLLGLAHGRGWGASSPVSE